jgi:hypothetical protein
VNQTIKPVAAAMCGNCPHSAIDHAYVPPYACRLCSCSGFVNAGFAEEPGGVLVVHGELELV